MIAVCELQFRSKAGSFTVMHWIILKKFCSVKNHGPVFRRAVHHGMHAIRVVGHSVM